MPHITIDYSQNLHEDIVRTGAVAAVHQAAIATGVFPVWGVRTFARPVAQCVIGNGEADNRFVHVHVRIAPGRDGALRERVTHQVFDGLLAALGPLFADHRIGCQVELSEFDARTTVFRNNLDDGLNPAAPVVVRGRV